jgi:hypothetical protein
MEDLTKEYIAAQNSRAIETINLCPYKAKN